MRKSKYSYGNKKLHELDKDTLLDCVEDMWSNKNSEISALEAKCAMYEKLLVSPHKTWGALVEKVLTYSWVGFVMFLFGNLIKTIN